MVLEQKFGIDITGAGFLGNLRELFQLTHCLNAGKHEEEWVRMELYSALSDPSVIVERIVKKYGLAGLLVSWDHQLFEGRTTVDYLKNDQVVDALRAIHVAKGDYSLITDQDKIIFQLLREVKNVKFPRPVRLALENYPGYLKNLSFEEKLRYFRSLIEKVRAA